ncbi:MAG: hypothetical protein M3Q39_04820 [Actinomycetota bacterium]|nr:hypothetical protein [Actinomycetota bacterium]MDQ3423395.1 hypothetical protein [Actinomycetota bacterium]
MSDFDDLLAEGLGLDVEAYWGAGFLEGRYRVKAPPWTWRELARPHLAGADSALDMGTGEGAAWSILRHCRVSLWLTRSGGRPCRPRLHACYPPA